METLASSTSDLFSGNYRGRVASSPINVHSSLQTRRRLRFPTHFAVRFAHSISLQRKCLLVQPICASSVPSSEPQKCLEDDEDQPEGQSKTGHVKFQLQKECSFGEQFYIVGNDPMLGLWEPSDAIPMDWSHGNIWTAELDLPIGKLIHFKFILKGSSGDILWQLGPDRTIQTWETKNTIVVSEDWENDELQEVVEEEPSSIHTEPITATETLDVVETPMAIVANNITYECNKSVAGNNGSALSVKNVAITNDEIIVSSEGAPILVPGLSPLLMVKSEEVSAVEIEDSGKSKDHDVLELKGAVNDSFCEKDVKEMTINDEKYDYEHEEMPQLTRGQEASNLNSSENKVLDNDIQWGLKTLQKLITGWGSKSRQSNRQL